MKIIIKRVLKIINISLFWDNDLFLVITKKIYTYITYSGLNMNFYVYKAILYKHYLYKFR